MKINNQRHRARRQLQRGFTLIEMLVVVAIVMTLSGIAIIGYRSVIQGANERLAIAQLSELVQAQTTYRTALGLARYGTLSELRAARPAGSPLVNPALINADGTGADYKGWTVTQLETPGLNNFGLRLSPTPDSGNTSTTTYFVFEDGVIRRAELEGPWTRGAGTPVE